MLWPGLSPKTGKTETQTKCEAARRLVNIRGDPTGLFVKGDGRSPSTPANARSIARVGRRDLG